MFDDENEKEKGDEFVVGHKYDKKNYMWFENTFTVSCARCLEVEPVGMCVFQFAVAHNRQESGLVDDFEGGGVKVCGVGDAKHKACDHLPQRRQVDTEDGGHQHCGKFSCKSDLGVYFGVVINEQRKKDSVLHIKV